MTYKNLTNKKKFSNFCEGETQIELTCWISLLWYSVLFTVASLSLLYLLLYLDLSVLGDDALIS